MNRQSGQGHRQGLRRWQTLNNFIDHGWREGGFTHAERCVWMTIFRKVGVRSRVQFSIRSIARDAGVSPTIARQAVEKMLRLKYLNVGFVSRRPGSPSGYFFLPEPEDGGRQTVYEGLGKPR